MAAELPDWVLEVNGVGFGTSAAVIGDHTADHAAIPQDPAMISLGIAATDVSLLAELVGERGRLLRQDGHELAQVELEKVDADLKLVVCRVFARTEYGKIVEHGTASSA